MNKILSFLAFCLVILCGLVSSVKYNCEVTRSNGISCNCDATGGSEARASGGNAKLSCKSDNDYCDSNTAGLPNGKVFIAFCTEEKIGLVHKTGENKYSYSEINNLACKYEKGKNVCRGSIDSEKKDTLNIYKRLLKKLRSLF